MDGRSKYLKLNNLSIGYDRSVGSDILLSSVSASAYIGEMIAVIGANGIGKSTLLRTITGLHKAIMGSVEINGKDVNQYTRAELALIFGFVGASDQVSQNLTVNELVALGRFPYTNWIGRLKNEDMAIISRSISNVGLDKFRNRKLSEMSDGERQRANIARVLAQDSKYIILDEPTAFLDLPNRYELVSLLKDIVDAENKTVIYTSHDFQIAINESDKVWLLREKSLKEGAPEDLILQDEFKKQFSETRLQFNNDMGEYLFPVKALARIGLKADTEYYSITKRALKRIKLEPVDNYSDLFVKVVDKNLWELFENNALVGSFRSIYELSMFLRDRFNNACCDGDLK